jgi:hypothetical protein
MALLCASIRFFTIILFCLRHSQSTSASRSSPQPHSASAKIQNRWATYSALSLCDSIIALFELSFSMVSRPCEIYVQTILLLRLHCLSSLPTTASAPISTCESLPTTPAGSVSLPNSNPDWVPHPRVHPFAAPLWALAPLVSRAGCPKEDPLGGYSGLAFSLTSTPWHARNGKKELWMKFCMAAGPVTRTR